MVDTEKPLHVLVAEALGWTYLGTGEVGWEGEPPQSDPRSSITRRLDQHIGVPRFDSDWATTGPLIEKYGITLVNDAPSWTTRFKAYEDYDGLTSYIFAYGETPLIAICNLILALDRAGKL